MLNKDDLFQMAKIIDTGFIGKENTFTAERKTGYWLLLTNQCDDVSLLT